ncbi:MAG TPA: T9SS type A sorting domain-containing protein [Flavobacterium sp.]|jgi:uncharacterized repeat protein (TIGR01451 family)
MKKLLLLIVALLQISWLSAQCLQPMNMTASSITENSVVLSWSSASPAMFWEISVFPAGSPAPQPSDSSITTSSNPFVFTGLSCQTNYDFYVRSLCDDGIMSDYSGPFTFWTMGCGGLGAAYMVCDNNNDGFESVDLTTNEAYFLAQVPIGNYTITYHLTEADAEAETNALPVLYTNTTNPQTIFVRIEDSTSGVAEITSADIIVNPPPVVPQIPVQVECDNNNDGIEYFDLALIAEYAWMESDQNPNNWTFSFYETLMDAEMNTNALAMWSYQNTVPFQQTIYFAVEDNITGCRIIDSVILQTQVCAGFNMVAFVDLNTNGIKDAGEPVFPHGQFQYEINNDATVHYGYSGSGNFVIHDDNTANSYDLNYIVNSEFSSYYAASGSFNNLPVLAGVLQNIYIPITQTGAYEDLAVSLVSYGAPRPGFNYVNRIVYTNNGATTIPAGNVVFSADADLSVTGTTAAGASIAASGVSFPFSNLLPFETRTEEVTMQVPLIPEIQLGDIVTNSVAISPTAGDSDLSNNTYYMWQVVVGSYDPNDKSESRGRNIDIDDFTTADYLYYTIRFENTGTADAIDVKITDMLNEQLDETSVRMISSSHNYVMDRQDNTLTWTFNNVQLPAASEDPDGAKGYVMFKAKPKTGYAIGDVIPNTASIYFDFNPAIVTNTWETEFVEELSVPGSEYAGFRLFPNPAKDNIHIQSGAAETISKVYVRDMLGKTVLALDGAGSEMLIDTSTISKGIYLVEIYSSGNRYIKKLVKE